MPAPQPSQPFATIQTSTGQTYYLQNGVITDQFTNAVTQLPPGCPPGSPLQVAQLNQLREIAMYLQQGLGVSDQPDDVQAAAESLPLPL